MSVDDRDARLRSHAGWQRGAFTLRQALEASFSRPTVRRRIASGTWEELAPRVYRVADGTRADWRTLTMAHVLSIDGAACRRSALAVHGLLEPPDEPEVVVVRKRRTGTRAPAPSTDSLEALDLTVVAGIPVTT